MPHGTHTEWLQGKTRLLCRSQHKKHSSIASDGPCPGCLVLHNGCYSCPKYMYDGYLDGITRTWSKASCQWTKPSLRATRLATLSSLLAYQLPCQLRYPLLDLFTDRLAGLPD